MSSPHITLAILTRNRPQCLARALAAVAAMTDPPDDVIVSDDSDEQAAASNRAIVAQYSLIRYTVGPRLGLGANENHIVSGLLAETEWVVFNGDDTRLPTSFVRDLRIALLKYAPRLRIPSGTETRNGNLIYPQRLDFLGFQTVPHADYSPGAALSGIVVQATPFPAEALREVMWLHVSPYGYDEVDMTHKMQKLGWRFVFEPSISLHHDQPEPDRTDYVRSTQVARFYFRLRSFSVYDRRPLLLALYLIAAPLHLVAARLKRGDLRAACGVPALMATSVRLWRRSLRGDWRKH